MQYKIKMQDKVSRKGLVAGTMKYIIPAVVSVGLCWVMFRNIDFDEMIAVIRRDCDFKWICIPLLISILSHIFRALRWQIQLNALNIKPTLFELVLSVFGTYAVNLVFPRLGEVWRTGYIAQCGRASFSKVFGSMVAERLADVVVALLLLLLSFVLASKTIVSYLSQNEETYRNVMDILTSPWPWMLVAVLIYLVWRLLTWRTSADSALGKVQTFMKNLWKGFASIGTMPGKMRWLLFTAMIWGCYFMQLYVAFYAFPFTRAVLDANGPVVALLAFTLSSLSMSVPSNGGIGPWQWAVMFVLMMYGVDMVDAGAFANVVLGTSTLLSIVLGIFTFVSIMLRRRRGAATLSK